MKIKIPRITNLAQRFMLGVIPISLAGIILLGVSAFYVTKIHITRSVGNEIRIFSQGVSSSVSNFFKQRQNDLETLSETSLLADYYNNADYGLTEEAEQYRQELERYFLKFAQRAGVYIRITYVDPKRREVCGIEDSKIIASGHLYKSDEILNKASADKKSGITRFPISVDPLYGAKITYARPVFDAAGNFRGTIVLEAGLKPLQDILNRLQVGSTGKTYITDSRQNPVLAGTDILEKKPFSPSDFTSNVPIEGTDLRVMVVAPLSDFQTPLRTISRFTVFLVTICGALVALFIYLTIKGMTRPIKKLVDATQRLAKDQVFEKVEITDHDEIGVLASSFNAMAGQLIERRKELESRLKELLVLQGMSAAVIEKLDADHICGICLEAAVAGLGFERCTLYLINRERTHIVGRHVHSTRDVGFTKEKMQERMVPLDSGDILAEVARTKKAVIVENPLENPRVNKRFIDEVATKAFCLVPVMTEQKVLGVMGVDNYYSGKQITYAQMNKLMLFCNFTALALENANLVTDVRMSEERYRSVLDNTPDAIAGLDASFRITVWNKGARALFGYSSEDIIGRPVAKLFELGAFETVMREVRKKGFFIGSCVPGVTSLGKKLELDVTWAGSGNGKSSGKEWTVVIRDTSEQRKLQAQLIQAEKLSAVGQLISGVAHELNNPLAVIIGYSELLHKTQTDPVCVPAEDMSDIYESSMRCGKIVANLLAFVRESRKKKQVVSISQIVRSSIGLMAYKLRKTENIAITQMESGHIPPVMADFHQIEQILVNLIQNACDALSQKEGEKKIEIKIHYRVNSVFISVSDNGHGIPEEIQSRIFDPFFTTKKEGEGTGLGLPICLRIAAEHGASLTCASAPGSGATFILELPIVKMPVEEAVGEGEKACKPSPGKRVLVVDDEPDFLGMMKRMLEAEGQIVRTASSALEAVEELKNGQYDIVICDVEMGPAKGFVVREKMLEMNSPAGFVFTTGNLLNSALLKKIKESGVPFLPKPFNMAELFYTLNEVYSKIKEESL